MTLFVLNARILDEFLALALREFQEGLADDLLLAEFLDEELVEIFYFGNGELGFAVGLLIFLVSVAVQPVGIYIDEILYQISGVAFSGIFWI